jgi:hypothetical protein
MNALGRREALALLGAALSAACGAGSQPPAASASPSENDPPLEIDPVVRIVPAAALRWLIEARPRELLANPALIPAIALLVPEARFNAFAAGHGGVDLRQVQELVIAAYPESTLAVARVPVDPGRVEVAFGGRAVAVEGRAASRGVTRLWGSIGNDREQVAIFGHSAVGLERGRKAADPGEAGHLASPLRAAIYFAEKRLARAAPALAALPLAEAAQKLGSAPLRAFAPGPFEGAWAKGLGGLLGATTAVAAGAWPTAPATAVRVEVVLTGAWGSDAEAAGQRLKAAFDVLASDPLGRLSRVDHPLDGPRVSAAPGELRLAVTLDAIALARGLNDVTSATVAEVMAY